MSQQYNCQQKQQFGHELLITDVFKIFLNYESSRIRLFELVRNTHPHHMAALLYLLDNLKRSKKIQVYVPNNLELTVRNCDCIYDICDRVTFNLERATTIVGLVPPTNSRKNETIMDFIMQMQMARLNPDSMTHNFKILLNNMGSDTYHAFLNNIQHGLFPDYLQSDRNEITLDTQTLIRKFLQYYEVTFELKNLVLHNVNPKNFTSLRRPKLIRITEFPFNVDTNYIVQPLYQGFRVVINTNNNVTRCYNVYGELIPGLMYTATFDINATFEAIILPINKKKCIKSWRYWNYKHSECIIVVDVFRIEQQMFTHVPFEERHQHICKITGPSVRLVADLTLDELFTKYKDCVKMFGGIVGCVIRNRQATCNELIQEFRFPLNVYYNFMHNKLIQMDGSVSFREKQIHYNITIKYEMAQYKTVCLAYSDDDMYYYICKFDNEIQQFLHVGRIRKLHIDVVPHKFKDAALFVVNSRAARKGVLLLRVYFNNNNGEKSIIGYEVKKTTSMYDIPYTNCPYDLFLV